MTQDEWARIAVELYGARARAQQVVVWHYVMLGVCLIGGAIALALCS